MAVERLAIAVSLLAALCVPAPASSQTRAYIVAVAMEDGLEAEAARVGAAARASLRNIDGVDWGGPDRAFLGYTDFMLERLQRARERLAEGQDAYLALELDRAADLFRGAVEDFDSAAAALEDPQDLGEAILYLGATLAANGRTRDARRVFQRLHVQMPHIEPDPSRFPPEVVQLYEQARPRDAANPQGALTVESEPPGAIAYVDFVARGRTPVTVENLVSGVHIARVSRPGATPFVEQFELGRRGSEQVNAFLTDDPATSGIAEQLIGLRTANVESMEAGGPVAEIALALEVDKIGVIRVSPSTQDPNRVQLELLMFDVASGNRVLRMYGPVPTAIGALESGVQQLVSGALEAALRSGDQVVDPEQIPATGTTNAVVTTTTPTDDGEIYEQWWFWAAVGGAVVAATAVIIAIAVSSGGQELGADRGGQIILEF